ncbi:member of asn/thr-rich large protein family [Methanosphaera stadtmanae DSM 3091]|uniref:Member of asn/thr-rich large protein family n=9 Tax=Methanosphaera TaxID=2316 RepID=Q2NH63_METST|nr:member of asn/thr-rich large protein family [Methanosphaera stadtmanae DSM 3091]
MNIMSTNKTMAFLLALIVLIIGLSAVSASDVSNTHEVQADSSHVDIPTTVKSIETSDNNIKAQEPSTNVKQKTNENSKSLNVQKTNKNIQTATKDIVSENTKSIEKTSIKQKSQKTADKSTYVVTKDTFNQYFNNGTLRDNIQNGDTLDFQGDFKTSSTENYTMIFNKPVNLISTTQNTNISLNSTSTDFFGKDYGDAVVFEKTASGSNITGLYFYNTQIIVKNASNIIFNNITKITENKKIGGGIGGFSIRENSSYVTVKNSYFYTRDNGGVSTLVGAYASHCIFDNNTLDVEGNVGNIIYFTTYNVDITDYSHTNEYNQITNNKIYGPSVSTSICYGITISGCHNLVENNTIEYNNGMGITIQWGSGTPEESGSGSSSSGVPTYNNTYRNNVLLNNSHFSPSSNSTIINNTVTGRTNLITNTILLNNTLNTVQTSGIVTIGNSSIGNITILSTPKKSKTSYIIENNTIDNIILKAASGSGDTTENITINNNNITGKIYVTQTSGDVNNINITSNNIGDYVALGEKRNQIVTNVLINNNKINSTKSYAIRITEKSENFTITNNQLYAINATGNSAIQNDGIMNNIYEFNNTPINPKTTITIDPIKNTTVENTVIISGKLLDENQKPITNATVKIGVKDPESKNKYNVITDENGVYTKEFEVYYEGLYMVEVSYSGDATHAPSKDESSFNVLEATTTSMNITGNYNLNNNITIHVSVVNNANMPVDGKVSITIDNNENIVDLVNGCANLTVTLTEAGIHTITATYLGNDVYGQSSTTENITVNKVNTTTMLNIAGVVGLNKNITITAMVKDDKNNPINNGMVSIEIDGDKQVLNLVNGSVELITSINTPGDHVITATYLGDDNYNPSSATETITLNKVNTTTMLNIADDIGLNKNITITAMVKDDKNNPINNGMVSIEIDGDKQVLNLVNGSVELITSINTPGDHVITATYLGDDNYNPSSATETITLNKVNTMVDVSIIKALTTNTTITVTVKTEDNTQITNGAINVLDENGNKITSGNITNGKYTVNLTPKAGTYYYTFEYLGNDMYNASKTVERIDVAKDKIRVDIYTLKALTTNTTVKLVITDSVKSPVNSGFISVVDSKGNVVSSGRVVNGIYMINMTPSAGAQKFTIKYSGDDTYKAINIIKTIGVAKDKIRVDIYTLKALTTNTTVKLVITDSVKSPVNSGFISVVDSKGNVVSSGRVVNGIYMINMTPSAGAQKFTIKYSGDDTYKAINIIKTIGVAKDKIRVDIYTLKALTTNTTVKLVITDSVKSPVNSGFISVVDSKGNVVSSGRVVNGIYMINMTPSAGAQKFTIKYSGDDTYKAINIIKTIGVAKDKIRVDIYTLKALTTNTTVKLVITDSVKNPVNSGFISVVDSKGNVVSSGRVVNGIYMINMTPSAGAQKFTIKYSGDDTYKAINIIKTIGVAKDKIRVDIYTLKALTTNTTVKLVITDSVKSPVNSGFISVVDSKGNVVSSGRVVNGIYMINMTPPAGAQKFTIKYSGDDTYKAVNIIKTIYVVKDKSTVKNLATTSQLNNLNSNITIEVSVKDI